MNSRLMPVAKTTRHTDTSTAREKLFFRRLGSVGEPVRFVLFLVLIDAFSFTAQAKPYSLSLASI